MATKTNTAMNAVDKIRDSLPDTVLAAMDSRKPKSNGQLRSGGENIDSRNASEKYRLGLDNMAERLRNASKPKKDRVSDKTQADIVGQKATYFSNMRSAFRAFPTNPGELDDATERADACRRFLSVSNGEKEVRTVQTMTLANAATRLKAAAVTHKNKGASFADALAILADVHGVDAAEFMPGVTAKSRKRGVSRQQTAKLRKAATCKAAKKSS